MPSIRDVASAAGVSPSSVSRVMTGSRRVSPAVTKKVLDASERLGYRGNDIARALRARTTRTVGMVIPEIANPFFPSVVQAIERELQDSGRELFLCDSQNDAELEATRLSALVARQVDGLLVSPCRVGESLPAVLDAVAAVPVIQVDRRVTNDIDYVGVDHDRAIREILAHLKSAGCRRLAFVTSDSSISTSAERLESYLRHAADFDPLSLDSVLVGDFSIDWGVRATESLLSNGPMPDAIICANDLIALGVSQRLRRAGVRVPDQVSITGYDDVGFAEIVEPALTSIRQPLHHLGREAVAMLRTRLAPDPYEGPPRQMVLTAQLVVRGSTGGGSS